MPIYEYRCEACGHELERLQRMSDAPLTDCPDCGRARLRRLVSAAGFRLKGGGWYETDFKQANKRNLAEGGGEKADKSDKGEKTERSAKPDAPKPAAGAKDAGSKPPASATSG